MWWGPVYKKLKYISNEPQIRYTFGINLYNFFVYWVVDMLSYKYGCTNITTFHSLKLKTYNTAIIENCNCNYNLNLYFIPTNHTWNKKKETKQTNKNKLTLKEKQPHSLLLAHEGVVG